MMRTVCFLLLLVTAFDCVMGQRKLATSTISPANRPQIHVTLPCPERCNCKSMDSKQQSQFKMAFCSEMPIGLHPNIKFLQISANLNHISSAQILQMEGQLYQLDLSGCNISSIEPGAFNSLSHLVTLRLSNNDIRKISNNMFSCPRLKILYLDGNSLEEMEDEAFVNLGKLRELFIQRNKLLEMSTILPPTLTILDASNNLISSVATELNQINLKTLDLCGNPLNRFPAINSSRTLESLCLEGNAAVLPFQAATRFPQLANITFIASSYYDAELDATTQAELGKLNKLVELSLVNYHLQSLKFLTGMKNLATLKLQKVTLDLYSDIDKVFQSLRILTHLNLDRSPQLVKPILQNTELISHLSGLRILSLKYTELISLADHNIPEEVRLDISFNPLHCDCKLVWIQHKERDTLGNFLYSKANTTCKTPQNAEGNRLDTQVNIITCSTEETKGHLMQIQDIPKTTTVFDFTDFTEYSKDSSSPNYLHGSTTEITPLKNEMTEETDHTTVFVVLGIVVLILVIIGIILAVTLSMMKNRRRKCQISPEDGDTAMQEQPQQQQQQQQMKTASSKDMLIKK